MIPLPPALFTCARGQVTRASLDDEGFTTLARSMVDGSPYSVVLLGGGGLDSGRHSIAAADPMLVMVAKGRSVRLEVPGWGALSFEAPPLDVLDRLCRALRPEFPKGDRPFAGGAVGYLAYELKNHIENLPQTAVDDLDLPEVFLVWPGRVLLHDRWGGTAEEFEIRPSDRPGMGAWLYEVERVSGLGPVHRAPPSRWGDRAKATPTPSGGVQSTFSHGAYLAAVTRIIDYIRAGDVYQVNLSQRFSFPFQGDPFDLWLALYRSNPAPFYGFVQAGDHQVLSTSMERFLRRVGRHVETRPIKGTRPRGRDPEEDGRLREELLSSPKDDAELSMIVDLMRNDLGKVCIPGSVEVTHHKRLEAYRNVYHLVSEVHGRLREGVTHRGLLEATFPGGSITGCPKIRAMEIIDELEPVVRHAYTGSIGYLGWHDNLDLNIAIRTAVIHQGKCSFSVGGGIVYDSDEEDEYRETLHKGRTFFDWMAAQGSHD